MGRERAPTEGFDMSRRVTRRDFIKAGAGGASFWIAGRQIGFGDATLPNEKLNIACVGVGGRGRASVDGCRSEAIVALCDVDRKTLEKAAADYPGAKLY